MIMNIWDPKNECMPREEIEQLQLERLQSLVNRCYKNVTFYHHKLKEMKIDPEEIRSLHDLQRLPFTTKDDLRKSYPYGMFAVPLREVVRIHSSSGTTGMATVVGYTRNDIRIWSNLVARFLTAGGVTKDDVIQIAFGYGLFTGGFGLHYGVERIGASVIQTSSGNTKRQILIMKDFKTTALVCTPSYALYIAEVMQEMDIDPKPLSLKLGLFGSEPWSEGIRAQIEDKLYISATDNYGLSEVIGPCVSGECESKNGLPIFEDHFIPEIVDPETGQPLPSGKRGELVLTTLTKEAFPLIRYRTGDITEFIDETCSCGRTHKRMKRISGRTDDMLIVRGVNVFPSQIEEILMKIEGTEPHYQIIVDRKKALDELEIWVEISENIFFDEMKKQKDMIDHIHRDISSNLGVSAKIKLVEPKSIERTTGKAKRVIDKRKI